MEGRTLFKKDRWVEVKVGTLPYLTFATSGVRERRLHKLTVWDYKYRGSLHWDFYVREKLVRLLVLGFKRFVMWSNHKLQFTIICNVSESQTSIHNHSWCYLVTNFNSLSFVVLSSDELQFTIICDVSDSQISIHEICDVTESLTTIHYHSWCYIITNFNSLSFVMVTKVFSSIISVLHNL